MNASEEQQLKLFLSNLVNTPAPTVDRQALNLIQEAFARQPHAAYLLTQRSLALALAIEAAQQRIAQLETELASQNQATRPQAWRGQAGQSANQWGRQQAMPTSATHAAASPQVQAQSSWSQGLMGSLLGAAAGVMIGQAIWQGVQHMVSPNNDLGTSGASLSEASLVDGPTQHAQSDWSSGLSYDQGAVDEGAIDEGAGDDWF